MRTRMRWIVVLSCSMAFAAQSQPTVPEGKARSDTLLLADALPFAPFLRPSRFLPNRPRTAMFEAEVNVPVHFWSRTRGLQAGTKERCFGSGLGEVSGCTFLFIPHFVLRQLDDDFAPSAPVRTPTFNPTVEFTRFSWGRPRDDYTTLVGLSLRLAHYSNGSDGCLYKNRTGEKCATVIPDSAAEINERDGSFSTHYVEASGQVAQLNFTETGVERHAALYEWAFRWNPGGKVGNDWGGMEDELSSLYGRTSFRTRYGQRWRTSSGKLDPAFSAEVEYERAFGRPDTLSANRLAFEASIWSPHFYGLGLGLRYVRGWDNYNIAFANDVRDRFSIGVIIDHSRAVTHTVAAAREVLRLRR